MILTKNIIDKYANSRRKLILEAWKEYMAEVKFKKNKVIKMN